MAITKNTTITGAEFRDFYQNHWPGTDWYHEDADFTFEDEEGKFILADDAKVKLDQCGYLCWQGPEGQPHRSGTAFPFIDFYRKHVKDATTKLVTVEVPLDKIDDLKRYIDSIGGKI